MLTTDVTPPTGPQTHSYRLMICSERFIGPGSARALKDKFAVRALRMQRVPDLTEGRTGYAYWECWTKMWQSHNTALPTTMAVFAHDDHGPLGGH